MEHSLNEHLDLGNAHYIHNPLELYNSSWEWDSDKFLNIPKNKPVVVNCSSEHWGVGNFIDSLYDELQQYVGKFIILSHNPKDHLRREHLLFYPYWYQDSIRRFSKQSMTDVKTYKLSCLNGNPRPHRILNYFRLMDKNYPSILVSIHTEDRIITKTDDDWLLDSTILEQWLQLVPQLKHRNEGCTQLPDNAAYLDSYVNLVTETTVIDRLFITEKTWKPVASGQLFLVLGNPGTIQFLREQGVDTFDDYIDHRYDFETDPTTKLDLLYKSLDQLLISNLEDIYKQTKQRRLENASRFFAGTFDSQYFKTLKECINTLN
jgi:hypothetical protein